VSEHQDWFPIPESATVQTYCTAADYDRMYAQSITDPDSFWAEQAKRIDWMTPPKRIGNWSYDPVSIKWYEDGVLNLCHNAVDRHVARGNGSAIAFIFEPDDPARDARRVSYAELQADVIRMANCLKKLGVTKGERVTIYMPMCVEGAVAMLACGADRRLRQPFCHLRRQRIARRQICAAKGEYRRCASKGCWRPGGVGHSA
jgi:acetyl-CoA synthetase